VGRRVSSQPRPAHPNSHVVLDGHHGPAAHSVYATAAIRAAWAARVFEPHRRVAWPTDGSVLLVHIGFRVKARREDGMTASGPVAFNVLAAAGCENGVMRLWHLRSAPTVLTADAQGKAREAL
jgi:hypothetical protein